MTTNAGDGGRRPRLAILSFSSGEYDARSFRIARSAIDAGWDVTMYSRWHPGLPPVEQRDGYRLVRAPFDWRIAIPGLRGRVLREARAAMAEAARAWESGVPPTGGAGPDAGADAGADAAADDGDADALGTDGERGARTSGRRAPFVVRLVRYPFRVARRFLKRTVKRTRRLVKRWRRTVLIFPLRPMAWAVALDDVLEPADLWHGMWAGSLPALLRASRRFGGGTVYDSRDVYMLSRDFARLEWPMRGILAGRERAWAQRVDRVLTVNEPYADLIAEQLGVQRPPVVINCPERWDPPVPAPDLVREALGIPATTAIALYQGQLITDRGIEESMDAILAVPDAVLVLLGFGPSADRYARMAAAAPYAGKVLLLPAVPPSELVAWTASADLLVMAIQPTTTNHRFTTPQKLWEAFAAGVPVVASDLPGMASVVRETGTGVLVDPQRPERIAEGIARITGAPPAERARLRRHVLRVAHERYTWEAQLETLFGLYRELVPGAPAPALPAMSVPSYADTDDDGDDAPARLAVPPGARLHLVDLPPTPTGRATRDPEETLVVVDTAWTPPDGRLPEGVVRIRDVVERVMRERDLFAEASVALDTWAEASGIVERLTHEGVSFWYGLRLRHWMWVLDHVVRLATADRLLAEHPGTAVIECEPGTDPMLATALRLVAGRDGLAFVQQPGGEDSGDGVPATTSSPLATAAAPTAPSAAGNAAAKKRAKAPKRGFRARLEWRFRPPEDERRRRILARRIDAIAAEPARRLLVVQAHARQRIDTPAGPRFLNVYLAPVVDRLRATRLRPFEVDIKASHARDDDFRTIAAAERTLPGDVMELLEPDTGHRAFREQTAELRAWVGALATPLVVSGVDLGPTLVAAVTEPAAGAWGRRLSETRRIRRLLARVRPAGILIADEYHRQDWFSAAASEGIPVVAVQHGVIYRWHTGYMHAMRPPELALPTRTYVFGDWERTLLTGTSVYRPDEVVTGGSPRLDLVDEAANTAPGTRETVRRELGVADGDRLLVLSGTWGPLYRRFHYPIALAALFAEPLERVHVVVKLHPSEKDAGPYRRIIEESAAAGGFAPPAISIVQDVDLYRLLAAADAHLGIHSTVLTEAVATGTPNLLATGLVGSDLLGYVEAGVAIPVQAPADLRAALDLPRDVALPPERRAAFLAAHFEPGSASERIAAGIQELLA